MADIAVLPAMLAFCPISSEYYGMLAAAQGSRSRQQVYAGLRRDPPVAQQRIAGILSSKARQWGLAQGNDPQ